MKDTNPTVPDHLSVLLTMLSPLRLTRIVDVGANPVEEPPYLDLLHAGGCDLLGFEPHPGAFAELQAQASRHETYLPHAVGDGTEVDFNIYRASGLSSVFPPYEGAFRFLGRSRGNMRRVDGARMPTKRLDDLPEARDMDLLKIDIQGGEVAVFTGAEKVLKDAVAVIVETRFYQLYENEPMLGGVDLALRAHGFQFHKFMFQKAKVLPSRWRDQLRARANRNQVIDGDAIYLRDLGADTPLGDDKLAHLAILSAAVFESHDLVLWALEQLTDRGTIPQSVGDAYLAALPPELTKRH